MEITVKMSEKEYIDYSEYKKEKEIFFKEYKKKLLDVLKEILESEDI